MNHRALILFSVYVAYYTLSGYALYLFEAEILLTSLVLFGVPAYALARFSNAPATVLAIVTVFGTGLAVLLEGIAHHYGLWYTVGIDAARLFGIVPVEAVVAMSLQVLFLALLYESMFDDGVYTERGLEQRFLAFGAFVMAVLVMVGLEVYVDTRFIESPYQWLISTLLLASLVSLVLYRSLTVRFLDRLMYLVLLAAVPVGLSVSLAATNVHKVFANLNEYAFSYQFASATVPLEEILLALTIPLVVATIYEIYLDDIA